MQVKVIYVANNIAVGWSKISCHGTLDNCIACKFPITPLQEKYKTKQNATNKQEPKLSSSVMLHVHNQ